MTETSAISLDRTSVASRFLAVASRLSDQIAIQGLGRSVSYGELAGHATAVSALLRQCEVPVGAPVAIAFDAPSEMIAAMLGCLMHGGVYVPLDRSMGQTWIESVLTSAAPALILTSLPEISAAGRKLGFFAHRFPNTVTDIVEDRSDIATPISILFTSGSTGRPKGVHQSQANVLFHADFLIRKLHIAPGVRHSLLPPFVFDASTSDIFSTLLGGGSLVPTRPEKLGLRTTCERLRDTYVTHLHMTPSLLRALLSQAQPGDFSSASYVILGGEPLYAGDVAQFNAHFPETCTLINGFGSTESSGFVTLYHVPRAYAGDRRDQVPVGSAVEGVCVTVDGPEHEIIVKTPHRAVGYWKDPEMTTKRFLRDGRLRTGDRGSIDGSGNLTLAGRLDREGKLRGVRIDLEGAEAWLMEHPFISAAACRISEDGAVLEGYLVTSRGNKDDVNHLESAFAASFPAYYQPLHLRSIAQMPLTPSNKVDYAALPAFFEPANREPPSTLDLALLQEHWRAYCAAEPDPNLPFFDAGFTSSSLAQYARALGESIARDIPISLFYTSPTLAQLWAALMSESPSPAPTGRSSRQSERLRRQQRLRGQRQSR